MNQQGFNVAIIPMLWTSSENYCYYVYRADDNKNGFVVDAGEYGPMKEFQEAWGIQEIKTVLTTHHHPDHAGANEEIRAANPNSAVVGGELDNVKGCTRTVKDGETWEIFDGAFQIKCHHTPSHTKGHIFYELSPTGPAPEDFSINRTEVNGYQVRENMTRCVFTGDTIFIGGCGKFFEGTAEQMLRNFDIALAMPEDTKMFSGHENSSMFMKFC